MSAAAEAPADGVHVGPLPGAQAGLDPAVGQFVEQAGDLHPAQFQGPVHQSLQVVVVGSAGVEIGLGEADAGMAARLQQGHAFEGPAEDPQLFRPALVVEVLVDPGRGHPLLDQFGGHPVHLGGGVGKPEIAGVVHHPGVERLGHGQGQGAMRRAARS